MVAAIRQQVTVTTGGVIEVRAPELTPGTRAEVIILLPDEPDPATPHASDAPPERRGGWQRHAGALRGGDPGSSDNDRIDEDLAREYGSGHPPPP